MNDRNHKLYRLERRPDEQGPRPLLGNQDKVEKLVTGITTTIARNTTNNPRATIASTRSATTNQVTTINSTEGSTMTNTSKANLSTTANSTATNSTTTSPTTGNSATNLATAKATTNKQNIMKDILTVGTWNVKTLWATEKLELL